MRRDTIQLIKFLQQQGHNIWIYTSSRRDLIYLRLLFRWYGISLEGIVNHDIHQQRVKKRRCTKYPPAFGIDLLIDDSRQIAIEARKYNFHLLQIAPEDENWYLKVIEKVKELEK